MKKQHEKDLKDGLRVFLLVAAVLNNYCTCLRHATACRFSSQEKESQRIADRGEAAKQFALASVECQKKMDELSAHNSRLLDKVVKERDFAEDKCQNHLKLYEVPWPDSCLPV